MNLKYFYKSVITILLTVFVVSCSHMNARNKVSRDLANSPGHKAAISNTDNIYQGNLIPKVDSVEDTDEAFERFKKTLDSGVNPNLPVVCTESDSGYVTCGWRNFTAKACRALNSKYLNELIRRDLDNLNGKHTGGLKSHVYETCLHQAFGSHFKADSVLKFIKEYVDRGLLDLRFADEGYLTLKGKSYNFSRTVDSPMDNSYPEKGYAWLSEDEYQIAKFLSDNGVDINYYVTSSGFASNFKSYEESSALLLKKYVKLGFDVNQNGNFRDEDGEPDNYILNGILDRLGRLRPKDGYTQDQYKNQIDALKVVLKEIGKINIEKYPYLKSVVWSVLNHTGVDHINKTDKIPYKLREEVVNILVENGANIKSFWLGRFASSDDIDAVKILLKFGADVNYKNGGAFALYGAAANGHLDMVKLLVENDADIHMNTKRNILARGWTAEKRAKKDGHTDVYEYLKAHRLKNSKVKKFLNKFN